PAHLALHLVAAPPARAAHHLVAAAQLDARVAAVHEEAQLAGAGVHHELLPQLAGGRVARGAVGGQPPGAVLALERAERPAALGPAVERAAGEVAVDDPRRREPLAAR